MAWQCAPWQIGMLCFALAISSTLPIIGAVLAKRIVDLVIDGTHHSVPSPHEHHTLVLLVALEFIAMAGIALLERLLWLLRITLGGKLGATINRQILDKSNSLSLQQFEDAKVYDLLKRARQESSIRPISFIENTGQIARCIVIFVGYSVILSKFSPWLVLALIAAAAPVFLAETYFSSKGFKAERTRMHSVRRMAYLQDLLCSDAHAKEIKFFGLGDLLIRRFEALNKAAHAEDLQLGKRRVFWSSSLALLSTLSFYVCYAVIVVFAARNEITIGEMTLYILALRQGQSAFGSFLASAATIFSDALYMGNLFEFYDLPVPAVETKRGRISASRQGLVFENVGFRYLSANSWALRNVSFFIKSGSTVALMGKNGAGKSTLIKILTGFYQPTEGRILLDGYDLKEWDPRIVRARMGVIFQDFNRYQFSVRDNVGFGNLLHLSDDGELRRALHQAGAGPLLASLPAGLEAQLGRWFENGTELSGGQWQKIALSRVFMRKSADMFILDEPAAALDIVAERIAFEEFRKATAGATTILVSHRPHIGALADTIVFLTDGRVVEQGSHFELLRADKEYAKMFGTETR